MAQCPQHIFLILTKRPRRMLEFVKDVAVPNYGIVKNIWLGCTVCNQAEADEKIPILLQIPAAVRWVSIEPMMGPINLSWELDHPQRTALSQLSWIVLGGETGPGARPMHPEWVRSVRDQCQAAGVPFFFKSWGEFLPIGPVKTRQVAICERCGWSGPITSDAIGKHRNGPDGCLGSCRVMYRVGKKAAGRLLNGREWNEFSDRK